MGLAGQRERTVRRPSGVAPDLAGQRLRRGPPTTTRGTNRDRVGHSAWRSALGRLVLEAAEGGASTGGGIGCAATGLIGWPSLPGRGRSCSEAGSLPTSPEPSPALSPILRACRPISLSRLTPFRVGRCVLPRHARAVRIPACEG